MEQIGTEEFGCLKFNKTGDIEQEATEPIIESIVKKNRKSILFGRLEAHPLPSKIKKTEYEEQLKNEIKEWTHVLKMKNKDINRLAAEEILIDKSIVCPETLDYLKKRISVNTFLQQSNEFIDKAEFYLSERSRVIDSKENFIKATKEFLREASDEIFDIAK